MSGVPRDESIGSRAWASKPVDALENEFLEVKQAGINTDGRQNVRERDGISRFRDARDVEGELTSSEFFQTGMCGAIDGLNVVDMNGGPKAPQPFIGNIECRTLDKSRAGYERAAQLASLARGYYDLPADHRVYEDEADSTVVGGPKNPHLRLAGDPTVDSRTRTTHRRTMIRASADGDAPKGMFAGKLWGPPTVEDRARPRRVTAEMVREKARAVRLAHSKEWAEAHRGHVRVADDKFSVLLTREMSKADMAKQDSSRFGIATRGIAKGFELPG